MLMLNEYIILDQVGSNSDGLQMKSFYWRTLANFHHR